MTPSEAQGSALTPLMRQYHAVKEKHPDKILFFRMGDFYEMFGDDAVKAAPILGVALTSRSHGDSERIPLAGVPYHSADKYLARLLQAGEKVVVVEQVEDPKTAKGLVKREIVEILTPGTATVEGVVSDQKPIWLAALFPLEGKKAGLAVLDLLSGDFMVEEGDRVAIVERLKVLGPNEILVACSRDESKPADLTGFSDGSGRLTPFEEWNFEYQTAVRELNDHFGTATLDGFGVSGKRLGLAAAGAILRYLKENHRDRLLHITRLTPLDDDHYMLLDYSTARNLELVQGVATGSEKHSLFGVVNRCQTAAGSRRLRASLLRPYNDRAAIQRRLGAVEELVKSRELCYQIRRQTKQLPDLERLAGRLGIGKLNPRQAASVGQALAVAAELRHRTETARSDLLADVARSLPDCSEIISRLSAALTEEPPPVSNRGGIIKPGFSSRLDDLNNSIRDARRYIGSLQEKERRRTGIASLKVGFNKVFGYYLEVTKANAAAVPDDYIRKQTLVNAERYITPDLKEKEELIASAEEKIFHLEAELYTQLVTFLNDHMADLVLTAALLAEVDLVSSLAELAVERSYVKPTVCDDNHLVIVNGRHPVVESVLAAGCFVANDVNIANDKGRIVILTGPNMSGKSTYLRQVGLIVVLAQIGSFVPADAAEIGLVDRVFTRVGAVDNLVGGQSTFLVEMVETANILHNATARSLVLLDEVGRGTSTFDGLSVAWAVVERLNEQHQPRTIFATHYHELTGMAELYPQIRNFQVAVKRWEDRVVFLHQIIAGGCDDSYGIEVAKLAGLPRGTISRAKQILKLLESGKFIQSELARGIYMERAQPSLFDQPPSKLEEQIRELDLDNMTPMEALGTLRRLRESLE